MYKNKTQPSETTILKIAKLADIPAEEALLDLQIWKAKSQEEKSVWEKLRSMVINLCLALTVLAIPWQLPATDSGNNR